MELLQPAVPDSHSRDNPIYGPGGDLCDRCNRFVADVSAHQQAHDDAVIDLSQGVRGTLRVDDPQGVTVMAPVNSLLTIVVTRPRGLSGGATDDVVQHPYKQSLELVQLPANWFERNDYVAVERR